MKKSQQAQKYRRLIQMLRKAREQAGLAQLDFAERLGTNASYVSKSESGERRIDAVELADFGRIDGYRSRNPWNWWD